MGSPLTDAFQRLSSALGSHYRLERELGQGGMATVYLAHDLRHDRPVALKVLRPELAAILGAERFLAEIKTTANLQHPHILSLFDSGEADGMVYYVMPYVEGESLRDRLTREQQLPVDEAVRIAREVADALEYAHQHGIVHRDIKPENILLHGGHAQVADFGIALAASRSDGGTRMTETGMSLGTPHYMAPEQAMGDREITPRADIYALGCVLYEMLTAEPPFQGATAQAIIARVMTEEPRSLTLQRRTVPPHVEAAVRTALQKLPADRFAHAAEFAAALGDAGFAGTRTAALTAAAGPPDWRARMAVPALALAALATLAAGWALLRRSPPAPTSRYGLVLPPSQAPVEIRRVVPSPDGSRLLYVGPAGGATGQSQLWLKPRDQYAATPVPGTLGAWNATFSPDGQWIAFVQEAKLRKTATSGGSPIFLADSVAPARSGIAWLDDGTIVYVQPGGGALRRVSAAGGASTVVFRTDSLPAVEPSPLPRARGVLFVRCASFRCDALDLWVLDLKSGAAHRLLPGTLMGTWLPTGHLLYVRADGAAFAVPFDLGSLETRGTPVSVVDSVVTLGTTPLLAVSRSGTLVARTGRSAQAGEYEIDWVTRAGVVSPIDMGDPVQMTAGGNGGVALSPDGRRLALGLSTGGGNSIWVKELPSGPMSLVTSDSGNDLRPRWMPGGRMLSYISLHAGANQLRRTAADGTGGDEVLVVRTGLVLEGEVSGDSRWIVVRTGGGIAGRSGRDIIGFHPGDTTPIPLMANPEIDESAPALSPDGRWIAYESDETGRREVYIRPFPATNGGRWQASTNGGMAPLWARNGRELFFVDADRRMVAVPVAGGSEPHLGERRPLFRLPDGAYLDETFYYTPFDISPDGQRFVMARLIQSAPGAAAPLVVVENWFTELERKLGGH
jgi:eukaryotic-like serine/threonine-protein kinase